ncbi:hypothetical protein TA3x_000733 [Tundrisphaera sp. TA3]|uniref:hypothetical protein n=1 Tax=Tundrisphaera sp. TA3 TaxID=3435775 RepID=UPI003EBD2B60
MNNQGPLPPVAASIRGGALVAGLVGMVLCAVGVFANIVDVRQFGRSYLFAYIFFLGLSLGSLALLMLHRQVGGAWGILVRRPLESGAMTLPLMALLFLPIAMNMGAIYPWVNHPAASHVPEGGNPSTPSALPDDAAHPEVKDHAEAKPGPVSLSPSLAKRAKFNFKDQVEATNVERLHFKNLWLKPNAWMIRAAIYFAIWIVLALILNAGSKAQDRNASKATDIAYRLQGLSAPGLVLYFLSVSFALVDWGMSLDPEWYSSIYGVLIIVGQGVSTMAFMILITALITGRGETDGLDTPETFNDLGNLLLAMTMLWAYISFSQFLIIWAGDLSEENPWYLVRLSGGWWYVGVGMIIFHFAVPFLLLLRRPFKRRIDTLWPVAALVLAAHFVNDYWLITPSFAIANDSLFNHWTDIAAPLGIGGLWLFVFFFFLKGKPLITLHDPELLPALRQAGGH